MTRASAIDRTELALLLVVGGIWGATFPVVRYGVTAGASPFTLLAVDFLLAAAAMAVVAAARTRSLPDLRAAGQSALLGLLLIGGINLLLFWAVQFTTGGIAAIVFASAPLLSIVTSSLVGVGGRPSSQGVAGLALGLVGVGILGLTSAGTAALTNPWALVALLGGAAAQAAGAALVSRYRPRGETAWGQSAQFLAAGMAALVVVEFTHAPLALATSASVVLTIIYVALLTGVVGYSVYFELIRRAGAVRANLVTYLNPVVALVVGFWAFDEPVSALEVVGLVIVLGSLYILHMPTSHESPTHSVGS